MPTLQLAVNNVLMRVQHLILCPPCAHGRETLAVTIPQTRHRSVAALQPNLSYRPILFGLHISLFH